MCACIEGRGLADRIEWGVVWMGINGWMGVEVWPDGGERSGVGQMLDSAGFVFFWGCLVWLIQGRFVCWVIG